jgi:hypothetical protein
MKNIFSMTAVALIFICLSVSASEDINEEGQSHKAELRAFQAFKLRTDAALKNLLDPLPKQPRNSDDVALIGYINSYTKGLPHDALGIVDAGAYRMYLDAINSGKSIDFEKIPKGANDGFGLRNPLAAYSFFLEGKDSHSFTMPAAPSFDSAWQAAEATEVLWKAIVRDVPFSEYANDKRITEAVADMISRARKMREGADKDSELAQKAMPTAVKTLRGVGREALVSASTR